jgi:hypothetical protein
MGKTEIILLIALPSLALIVAAIFIIVSRLRPHLHKSSGMVEETPNGNIEYVVPEVGTPYLIKKNEAGEILDEPFKILTCADLHIHSDHSELTFTVLSRFLEKEKPDLVILLGDNIVGRTDIVMQETLKRFFEERKQHWAFVLGNHDSERKIKEDIKEAEKKGKLTREQKEQINAEGRKWMFDSLSGGPYCVVRDEREDEISGSGNCIVNIKNSNGITQSLVFFDSGDYIYDDKIKRKGFVTDKRSYDYIKEDQIAWYKKRIQEITAENGGIAPKSMAFFHIPLREYQEAFTHVVLKNGRAKRVYGNNMEPVCASNIKSAIFEAFRESGSTNCVVCGHDHKNDSSIIYKGIRLMYSQGLQYDRAYNRRKKAYFLKLLNNISPRLCCFVEGVTIFIVKSDGTVEITPRYAQKENVFHGLEKHYSSAYLTGSVNRKRIKE